MASLTSISTRRVQTGTIYFMALLREELGRRIKTARVGAGLSQRELADLIHLKNASDVSRYERGTVEVPSHRIDLIAEATSRPRSYFTRDPSEPETPVQQPGQGLDHLRERLEAEIERLSGLNDQLEQRLGEQQPARRTRKHG